MTLFPPHSCWSRRFVAELALLGALLIHALLFLLIRRQTVESAQPQPGDPEIAILPLASQEPREQDFMAWAKLVDPTLLILADSQRGFSQWLTESRPQPLALISSVPVSLAALAKPRILSEAVAESDVETPFAELLQRHWRIRQPSPEELGTVPLEPAAPLPTGVLWRFVDGTPLDEPVLRLDDTVVLAELAKLPPTQPSRFSMQLGTAAAPSRLRLVASSGNPALDQLAYAALGPALLAWERRPPPGRFGLPARQEVVEVEWRLLTP